MMLWWDLRVAAWDKINKGGGGKHQKWCKKH